jgi:molybdopterin-guanine dinucleotide biosynthesis protein A
VDASAIILAGGKSTRFGRDKAAALLAGKSMLQRAVDACTEVALSLIIVKARGQTLPDVLTDLRLRTIEDAFPESGPLGGIYTGLAAAEIPYAVVVACDLPLLQPALLRALVELAAGHDAAIPVRNGAPEPLCAVYSRTCIEPARERLESHRFSAAGLLEDVDALLVTEEEWQRHDPAGRSFLNVNREGDLREAEALLADAPR